MANILVAFPNANDARNIRSVLVRNGFRVIAVCTTGAQVLNYSEDLNDAVIICGHRLNDMNYDELFACLPETYHMLLIASERFWGNVDSPRLMMIGMPLKMHNLLETVSMLDEILARNRRKRRNVPRERSAEDRKYMDQAKKLLMERNHMTEEEAHRYIQKCSMDSGTNMVETARMILQLM